MRIRGRWSVTISTAIGLFWVAVTPAHADPAGDDSVSPFPEMNRITTWYTELDPAEFFIPDAPGVWFLSPTGLNCGIWNLGAFGCAGDIPGAPSGDNHIAWFNGNRAVNHGWTAAIQFPRGQAKRVLPPRSYVTSNSTTCAVTPEGNTYCGHGEFKLLTTPTGTWFKAWDDRRSYTCLSYGSC